VVEAQIRPTSLSKIAVAQERRTRPLALLRKSKKSKKRSRLMSKPEVIEITGHTYPTIWAWMRDGKFPRGREVAGKTYWFEHEIDDWLASLPLARLKGDAA
jgi:predicted DNA-binding transcriptional regulator AlpA